MEQLNNRIEKTELAEEMYNKLFKENLGNLIENVQRSTSHHSLKIKTYKELADGPTAGDNASE